MYTPLMFNALYHFCPIFLAYRLKTAHRIPRTMTKIIANAINVFILFPLEFSWFSGYIKSREPSR